MGLPPLTRPFLLRHKWLVEMISFVIAVASIGTTYWVHLQLRAASDRMVASDGGALNFTPVWWSYAIAGLSALAALFKAGVAFQENRAANKKESPTDLHGCCIVLHSMLNGLTDGAGLRVTVHGVTEWKKRTPHTLVQLVPYACPENTPNGEVGRFFSASCGIIGMAARTGKPHAANRRAATHAEFIEEMTEWGYSREQAHEMDESRWAWMACPLFDKHKKVIGVVFLDSCKKDHFSRERQDEVLRGVAGVNAFIKERYP